MRGQALASEPSDASLNPNNTKSNRTQLKIDRHRKKYHKPSSNYYIMTRHSFYPGAQKTQQRGLHGLVIVGIGFRLAYPLLSLPTAFPTCYVTLWNAAWARGHMCHAISFLVAKMFITMCSTSLDVHRMNVRCNKRMGITYQLTSSCTNSSFKMVILIWPVFHAIISLQGLGLTESPGVVTAIVLGARWIPSRENQKETWREKQLRCAKDSSDSHKVTHGASPVTGYYL